MENVIFVHRLKNLNQLIKISVFKPVTRKLKVSIRRKYAYMSWFNHGEPLCMDHPGNVQFIMGIPIIS